MTFSTSLLFCPEISGMSQSLSTINLSASAVAYLALIVAMTESTRESDMEIFKGNQKLTKMILTIGTESGATCFLKIIVYRIV